MEPYYGVKYISRSCCTDNDVAVSISTKTDKIIDIKTSSTIHAPLTIPHQATTCEKQLLLENPIL